jgi:hypothetical protein
MSSFCIAAKRRREIVTHAKYVGAADSDDLSRWLIAWVWHNPGAKDQIWSLMQCAQNIGRKITEEEASEITEEASITRKHLTANRLAKFLGVTYAVRQHLGLTTISSINVPSRALKELRKRRDKLKKEAKRRAGGGILTTEDRPASPSRRKGLSEGYLTLVKKEEVNRLADCSTLAADRHETLPMELRMAALCLPMPEMRIAA